MYVYITHCKSICVYVCICIYTHVCIYNIHICVNLTDSPKSSNHPCSKALLLLRDRLWGLRSTTTIHNRSRAKHKTMRPWHVPPLGYAWSRIARKIYQTRCITGLQRTIAWQIQIFTNRRVPTGFLNNFKIGWILKVHQLQIDVLCQAPGSGPGIRESRWWFGWCCCSAGNLFPVGISMGFLMGNICGT